MHCGEGFYSGHAEFMLSCPKVWDGILKRAHLRTPLGLFTHGSGIFLKPSGILLDTV